MIQQFMGMQRMQRKLIMARIEPVMHDLAQRCVPCRHQAELLEQVLSDGFSTLQSEFFPQTSHLAGAP